MTTEKTVTIILPDIPAGVGHVSRHTENVPLETVSLEEIAQIVLTAAVQGHEIKRSADTRSGVTITITRNIPNQNKFGIGA